MMSDAEFWLRSMITMSSELRLGCRWRRIWWRHGRPAEIADDRDGIITSNNFLKINAHVRFF